MHALLLSGVLALAPIDLQLNPLADLHYWVRTLAVGGEVPADIPGLPEAVAVARQLDAEFGHPVVWGLLDGNLVRAANAAELATIAAQLPESFSLRDGRTVQIREGATRLAAAYRKVETPFLEKVWPQHRRLAEEAAARLRRDFIPKTGEVYAQISQQLGVPAPSRPFTIYLVAQGPPPGAYTHRSRGGAISVVAVHEVAGPQLFEMVVHETIHVLDLAAGEGSVLGELRRKLKGASPKEVEDFVHTVMFVEAAGAVRQGVDPGHQDYGDITGYYAKVPRAASVVVPAWRAYLAGEISREAAVAKIIEGFKGNEKGDPKAAPKPAPGG